MSFLYITPYVEFDKSRIMESDIHNQQMMKKHILITTFLLLTTTAFAQTADADKILGTYTTEGNKGKVAMSKTGNKYNGTLIRTNTPDARDAKNPDQTKRNNKLVGTIIAKDFEYTGGNTWEKGTVYDPENGKTYSGKITLNKDGSLRGFVGISAFGRTTTWKRD
jgi:uncharacterized protein (DUF2147 family)